MKEGRAKEINRDGEEGHKQKEEGNYNGTWRAVANNISIDFSPAVCLLFFVSRLHLGWCSWR